MNKYISLLYLFGSFLVAWTWALLTQSEQTISLKHLSLYNNAVIFISSIPIAFGGMILPVSIGWMITRNKPFKTKSKSIFISTLVICTLSSIGNLYAQGSI